jgi:hypothetical protein
VWATVRSVEETFGMASKRELRQRLKESGQWSEFCAVRERLKEEGVAASEAWDRAASEVLSSVSEGGYVDDSAGVVSSMFEGKSATPREIVNWVFENVDVIDCEPADAPSAGAWALLRRLRSDGRLLTEFYRSIWTKVLPSRSELDDMEAVDDDGREVRQAISRLEHAVLPDGAEGS